MTKPQSATGKEGEGDARRRVVPGKQGSTRLCHPFREVANGSPRYRNNARAGNAFDTTPNSSPILAVGTRW